MAMNPMQRKANNYLLLGIFGTLIITGIIIVFLFIQLNNLQQKQNEEQKQLKSVYVLNQDVKSGQILTEDMLTMQEVRIDTIPSDAANSQEVVSNWFLVTNDGDNIYTDNSGEINASTSTQITNLYINKSDLIIEVYQKEDNENQYYMIQDGEEKDVKSSVRQDSDGYYIVSNENNEDSIARIYQTSAGNYYIYVYNETTKVREKQDIKIDNIPLIAKVDMKMNTVITPSLVRKSDSATDLRKQEYNMVILPTQIESGDYIDIRLRLSNGVDYVVVSKKMVEIPIIDGVESVNTMSVDMSEQETMIMANAIIEAYIDQGSLLYATTYVEPGMQDSIIETYIPSYAVQNAINANPNIAQQAKIELFTRYSQNDGIRTNFIDGTLAQYAQDRVDNIEEGVQEQITKAQEERQAYLESLGGY